MLYPTIIAILVLIILALSAAVVILWRRTRQVVYGLDEISEDALKALYHLSRQSPTVSSRDLIRSAELEPSRYPIIAAELQRRSGPSSTAMACASRLPASGGRWS